jgi:sarcosine oxidase
MTNDSTLRPDVLVIGLGAMGSATTYQLAKRGARVIGIDQFSPPHAHGSTHGETRITRQAIGEGRQFVPLALRSHELWREIERETGRALLTRCGGLIVARAGRASHMHEQSDFFGDTVRAAREFGVAHELLSVADIEARYPQLALDGDETGYFEPGAGYLAPEACVSAQLELAVRHGATLHNGERVLAIRNGSGQTVVQTDQRTYTPGTTIVSAGPWLPGLLPQFAPKLVVRRQVLYWFETESDAGYGANKFPIFIWHWGSGPDDVFYGFPQVDGDAGAHAIKIATEQCETSTTPEAVNRDVAPEEISTMFEQHIRGRLRGVGARCVKAATCLYTNAPGANFLIDRLPEAPDVIVVSACSGHGFKHSAAIGEAVATMAMTGEKPESLRPFSIKNGFYGV